MNDDVIVVYTDGSLYNKDHFKTKVCNVGLGVYIIDNKNNDIKISKGFSSAKLIKGDLVEISALSLFLDYVENKIEYTDKKFVIYSDSEDVINLINNNTSSLKVNVKDDFINKIKKINIQGAYWVKGHSKEIGNLIVDTLAYNGLRMNKDNNIDYESVSSNKHLNEIFTEVKRCPKNYILKMSNKDINNESYNRILHVENNVTDKRDSERFKKYKENISFIPDGDNFKVVIGLLNNELCLNGIPLPEKNFENIIDVIISDQSRMTELNMKGDIHISFENIPFVQNLELLYNQGIAMKFETNKVKKEFMNTDEYHAGMLKLGRNKRFIVDFSDKPKMRFKP